MKKQKASKKVYRLRNWREYNEALKNRGSISIWISQEALDQWQSCPSTGKAGRPQKYSDLAIETMLRVKAVYRLGYRQMEGFVRSMFRVMEIDLAVPSSTQVNRRGRTLGVELASGRSSGSTDGRHVVIDSTGVKVYGEGEWKVRQHGISKRRTWLKLHVAADESTGELLCVALTSNGVDDAAMTEELLQGVEGRIDQVSADTGYDKRKAYTAISQRGARAVIPPQKKAKIWQHGNCNGPPHDRDENLRSIRTQGRRAWKKESGYHRRSIVENVMYRYKTIFGDRMSSRQFEHQATEAFIKCSVLNHMSALGMPRSYAVP